MTPTPKIGCSTDPARPGPTCAAHFPTHHCDCPVCRDTLNQRVELHLNPPGGRVSEGPVPTNPLDAQVAGDHYKKLKIQPIEYIHANGIPFAEGNVIKYVSRWRVKGGIKDLEKAKHFIEMLIELESKQRDG